MLLKQIIFSLLTTMQCKLYNIFSDGNIFEIEYVVLFI